MRARVSVLSAFALAAAAVFAPTTAAPCEPSSYSPTLTFESFALTAYLDVTAHGAAIFLETNGFLGLQRGDEETCGGAFETDTILI